MIDSPSFHERIVFSGLKIVRSNRAWWYTLLIPVIGRSRQAEFEASEGYVVVGGKWGKPRQGGRR